MKTKILFIDTALHKSNATGITLTNLFELWTKDKLYMIGENLQVKLSIDAGYTNVYILSKKEYKHLFPFNIIVKLLNIKRKVFQSNNILKEKIKEVPIQKSLKKINKLKNLFKKQISNVLTFLGLDYYYQRCILSEDLKNWINEVNPDFFYALLSTRHSILFAKEITKNFNIPLFIHIMDDWPSIIGQNSLFPKYWNKKINNEFKSLLALTYKRLAISHLMAEEYKKRFGGDWLYFHNPVDVSLWNKPNKNTKQNKSRTILYSGRLSQGISGTLKLISECVNEINDIDKLDVKFRIQSSGKPDWIDNYNNTTFNFYIPYEELPELYAQVDVLLLPYEFEGKGFDFIRLSMPTKATEYMASATPILIVAPKSTAVVEYANREGWAYVIDDNNKELIRKGIIELINNEEIRMSISNNALRCALNSHEINKVQFEFSQIFN